MKSEVKFEVKILASIIHVFEKYNFWYYIIKSKKEYNTEN